MGEATHDLTCGLSLPLPVSFPGAWCFEFKVIIKLFETKGLTHPIASALSTAHFLRVFLLAELQRDPDSMDILNLQWEVSKH